MAIVCLTADEIQARLVAVGVQPTAQRIAICQYVLCDADHPSAEDVKLWADKNFPKISLATVYNTLSTLVGTGLLREYRFPHTDKTLYDNNIHEHHHMLDESTGKLYDIPTDQVSIELRLDQAMNKYQFTSMDLLIRGKQINPVGGKK